MNKKDLVEKLAAESNMRRTPIHPGEILADELAELNMSASELAKNIHVPPNRISRFWRENAPSPPRPH